MICGVDAGGTYTRYIVMNDEGEAVLTLTHDSMHFMREGYAKISQELSHFKEILLSKNIDPQTLHLVIGMAGYGGDATVRHLIEKEVFTVFPNAILMNDARLAHYAALMGEDGVFVISGTGSIALRKNESEWERSGGFGYLLDDAGSGFWIGKQILDAFVRQSDGRQEEGPLYRSVLEVFNLDSPFELIALVNDNKDNYRNWTAELAAKFAQCDDEDVRQILKRAGVELALLANTFDVSPNTPLSVGGSVLLKNQIVRQSFIDNLRSEYQYVEPKVAPEYGAFWVNRA